MAWLLQDKKPLPAPVSADTRRNNNAIITSKRRRFDVIMTPLLLYVSAGSFDQDN